MRPHRIVSSLGSLACCLALVALSLGVGAGPATAEAPTPLANWDPAGSSTWYFWRSQGLSTDTATANTVYTSIFTMELADATGASAKFLWGIPWDLLLQGYYHIGDTDTRDGKVYAPYNSKSEKAFGIWDADTLQLLYVTRHVLGAGEDADNTFSAVPPSGDHMVAGEWDTISRLLVFPLPQVGVATVDPVAEIHLSEPLAKIQGCDFETATRLVCTSDDDATGNSVYAVDLSAPVGGGDLTGTVTRIGAVPQENAVPGLAWLCGTAGEVEGIDVASGALRLLVVDPCFLWTHEYRYT